MTGLHFRTLSLQLRLQLKPEAWKDQVTDPPIQVGKQAAKFVDEYARQHQLGYYPALDFFRERPEALFDPDLLTTLDRLAWMGAQRVRDEAINQLGPVFSSVTVESVQSLCYLMPTVRPRQADALQALEQHFTPGHIKLGLKVTMLQKRSNPEGLEAFTRKAAWKWLQDAFANVEVSQARLSKL